jgi:lysophospholipase L1-like esterase
MRSEQRRSARALVTGILCGTVLAATLVGFATRTHPMVKDAAIRRPAVQAAVVHSVSFIGDSWTYGEGASTPSAGYAYRTAQQLGWRYQVLGVGGSGYDRRGGGGVFATRINQAVAFRPEVIVVQGSLNERHSTPAALATAALSTLRTLRAKAPSVTKILVIGAPYSPGTPNSTIDWINADISAAAAKVHLPFVNPARENWTDPSDPAIWFNEDHPNDVGHQLVASHVEALLRALVGS